MNNITNIEEYMKGLKPKEKQALVIAKKHLGSLLSLEKTNHYLQWTKEKNNNNNIKH